jgi:tetratricopeptide (TPR) repeat protein
LFFSLSNGKKNRRLRGLRSDRPGLFAFALALVAQILFGSISFCLCPAALAVKKGITENTSGPAMKNYKIGLKCNEKKDYDGAIDAELQAIYYSRNGYFPDAYYQLGLAYQSKEDFPKAYEALSKACSQAMKPFNEAHLALAQVCTSQKKFMEATGEQAKAYEGLAYGGSFLWGRIKYQEAWNLEEWGNIEAATMTYAACLGPYPWKYWWPWIRFNECLMKLKKWSEAYQSFEKMLQSPFDMKDFDEERIYLDMGICALAKGNHEGALQCWHKVLEYNPDNKEAHLQLALMLDSEQHLKSAITEYKAFVRQAGDKDEVRLKQVESRISLLEQMQGKVDSPPPQIAPSMYMRQQKKQQQQQEQQGTTEPGF